MDSESQFGGGATNIPDNPLRGIKVNRGISRRNFLKVALIGGAAWAIGPRVVNTISNSNPDINSGQPSNPNILNKPRIYLEWQEVNNPEINRYFNSPQSWEYISPKDSSRSLYTRQLSMEVAEEPGTNKIFVKTSDPQQETYSFYTNPEDRQTYLENQDGVYFPTTLDDRYLRATLGNFKDSTVKVLVGEVAFVPKSTTILRWKPADSVDPNLIKSISIGPLVPNVSTSPEDSQSLQKDVSITSSIWQDPSYYFEVTDQSENTSIFKAIPVSVDGLQQSS